MDLKCLLASLGFLGLCLGASLRTGDEEIEDPLCECVPYYQCDEDRRIKVHGEDIIDPRMPICPDIEICCIPPNGTIPVMTTVEPEHVSEDPKLPPVDPDQPKCECVPFFLCDENRQHVTDGSNQLDERLQSRFTCPRDEDVCCYPEPVVTERPPGGTGTVPVGPVSPPDSGDDDGYTTVPVPHRPNNTGLCGYKGITESVDFGNAFRITGVDGVPEPTGFGEFPWMVAVMKYDGQESNVICGGSVITPSVILTAAHCLKKVGNSAIKVRAGEWDLYSTKEPIPHQDREVARVIAHPKFNKANLHNDIAILVLESPLELTASVDTVCAPEKQPKIDFQNCLATGWGKTGYGPNGTLPGILKKVKLPIIPNDECQQRLRKSRLGSYFHLHESFICAGGIPEQDTCTGDGGGPLVCPVSDDGRYAQVGIVAWGIGCGNDFPAAYASVEYFSSWIDENLKEIS